MAIQSTGNYPRGLRPLVKRWFELGEKTHAPEWPVVFDREMADRQFEEFSSDVGYGLIPIKPELEGLTYDTRREGWTTRMTPVRYVGGFIVSYESIKNNRWGPVGKQSARDLRRSFLVTKDTVGGLVLSRAFNSTYTGADSVELCSTQHVRKSDGSVFSNELTVAADLSELSVEQLCIQIMQATDERGMQSAINPLRLVVHPNDSFNAARITKSVQQNDTANNATNALREMGIFKQPFAVNRFFSAGDGVWFIKTDASVGMIYLEREGLSFDQDNDFDTDNFKAKAAEWYTFGWANPYGLWGSAGAA